VVLDELEARGVRAVRFDTDVHGDRSLAGLVVGDNRALPYLHVGSQTLEGEEVTAVLYRHLHLREAPHVRELRARELARSELRATLEGALLAIDCYWLNHPYANRLARNKPLQLALASRLGLSVPDTRITDDPEEIRALHRRWDGGMVAKLVGGQIVASSGDEQYVVYTTLVTAEDLRSDAALAACPAIYQRRIEKAFDLRVTVVGERLFACRIDSQSQPDGSVDWRRAGVGAVPIHACELDEDVAARCLALMRALRLDLAGLDLIVTPDGETVFLEVNAAGQWLWVQQATGMGIAAAIADQLISGAHDPPITRPASVPTLM
jgi:glutathione synthase/RimK-type ligase-like ATP-grasp enzyme